MPSSVHARLSLLVTQQQITDVLACTHSHVPTCRHACSRVTRVWSSAVYSGQPTHAGGQNRSRITSNLTKWLETLRSATHCHDSLRH